MCGLVLSLLRATIHTHLLQYSSVRVVAMSIRPRDASVPPRQPSFLSSWASPPSNLSSSTLVATRLTPIPTHQVPSRRTPILTTEDTRIAQNTSADATNAHHLENPVGPRRARQVWPLASLEHVYVGRNLTV